MANSPKVNLSPPAGTLYCEPGQIAFTVMRSDGSGRYDCYCKTPTPTEGGAAQSLLQFENGSYISSLESNIGSSFYPIERIDGFATIKLNEKVYYLYVLDQAFRLFTDVDSYYGELSISLIEESIRSGTFIRNDGAEVNFSIPSVETGNDSEPLHKILTE